MARKIKASLLILTCCSLVLGCSQPTNSSGNKTSAVEDQAPAPAAQSVPPKAKETEILPMIDQRITLMAVGDIMVHQEQLEAAWDNERQSYNFHPFFVKVAPLFKEADLVIGNLETTLSGKAARYTGYPEFNTPESLALTLKQVGFTAVTTANNHSLDRREAGVLSTLAFLDQADLKHTGTFRNAKERDQPLLLEKNGIKLALLSYSYGTNGIPIPKGKPYLINLIQPYLIQKDIAAARAMGADLVAVALHFGAEYQRMPNESQKKIADQCIAAGADLIVGAHPHVLQPYEWRTVSLGDGTKRTGFVFYSLGNFISAQRRDYKDIGAIAKLKILKRMTGETVLEEVEMIPTYVHYYRAQGKRHYVIYPLTQIVAASHAGKDPLLTKQLLQSMSKMYRETMAHLTSLTVKKKTG